MIRTEPVRPEDDGFLLQVYIATRRDEVAAWGWDTAQQDAFLRMQFQVQQRAYGLQYPNADHRMIMAGETPLGRLIVFRAAGEILLVDIALLPPYRNAGIGARLIRELQGEAAESRRPLRLRVNKSNPARRLYDRLGFRVTGETEMQYAMEWILDLAEG